MAAVVSTRITRLQAISPRTTHSTQIETSQILAAANVGTKIGTVTWDASGVPTGGDGMALTAHGLIVVQSGALVGYIDLSGNISMSGPLSSIGGFSIGSDYIRDAANSMGLASTVTGADDVRFWAGAAFASRASAPFYVTESGVLNAKILVLQSQSVPASPYTGQIIFAADGTLQYWTGASWATMITSNSIIVPTVSLASLIPTMGIATNNDSSGGAFTSNPPTVSLATLIPTQTVTATSP